jgi:hypothetical protein
MKEERPEDHAIAAAKHAERQRGYYQKNKERLLSQQAAYRERNKASIYAKQKEYRDRNRPVISARNRHKKYGITPAEFDALISGQGGRCAICADRLDVDGYRKIHVDHCHTTGRVRSILCSGCNVGLGHFRESPELLRKAAAYAEVNKVPAE